MNASAVPRVHDVVKILAGTHRGDLCIVCSVVGGVLTVSHGINTMYELPLRAVAVMCRPGWRDNIQ